MNLISQTKKVFGLLATIIKEDKMQKRISHFILRNGKNIFTCKLYYTDFQLIKICIKKKTFVRI